MPVPASTLTSVPDEPHTLQDYRFDRALADLYVEDPHARISLDSTTGIAVGLDAHVRITMPPAAQSLPSSDRAAAAAVLFLDRLGDLFGVPGWHVLDPATVSPMGNQFWFVFTVSAPSSINEITVCSIENTVKHVRVTG